MIIKRRKNESIESLIRRFVVACGRYGVRHDMKKHEKYLKPSEKKNIKNESIKYEQKRQLKKDAKRKRENKTKKRRFNGKY